MRDPNPPSRKAFRIDADFHLPQAPVTDLLKHVEPYWERQVTDREIHQTAFRLTSYPAQSPMTKGAAWDGLDVAAALDKSGADIAVCSMLHGVVALHNPDMRAALMSAVNDHVAETWLAADPRLRGSIYVSGEDPAAAVAEIERLGDDPRFVQVLLLAMQELPHGSRHYWPIYAAAQAKGLSIAIHAGGLYRLPPSIAGWPSYQFEDYVMQSGVFENILIALVAEGVLTQFPDLNFIFLESGWSWLPTTLWRSDKTWRGVRQEVPWVDRKPSEMIKDRVFLSLTPADPPGAKEVETVFKHIGRSDMILWSTDYPHGQTGGGAIPDGFPEDAIPGLLSGNARRAWPRLAADPAVPAPALEETE